MAQVKLKDEKILSDKHYVLKEVHFDLQQRNGEWESQQREVFDHGNAVTVLLYNPDEKTVILTKQFRIATYVNGNSSGMLVETCAGLLDKNETPEAAIIREIKEETGYQISQVEKVFEAYSSAGSLSELIYFYVAPYNKAQRTSKGGGLAEEGEDVEVLEMPFADALQMLEKGEIRDAKTIILLQYVQLKKLL